MMKRFSKNLLLPFAALCLAMPNMASAQEPQFEPVMASFSGHGSLILPGMPALDINSYGTIEFWVAAKWSADPGYDPAILSYTGARGPRFAVVITGDKQQLGVYAGRNYATVPFDFSDGEIHYVALTTLGDSIAVMIDGEIQAELDFGFANVPANSFSIGSMGRFSPFIGEIGQVRIWDEPIDPDVLIDFSWKEIAAEGPGAHPDIASLVGISAFANPETGGFIFVGDPDDPEIATATDVAFDDREFDRQYDALPASGN